MAGSSLILKRFCHGKHYLIEQTDEGLMSGVWVARFNDRMQYLAAAIS